MDVTNEFEIKDGQPGQGTLLITDYRQLLRPAPPQQHGPFTHDVAWANGLLRLGHQEVWQPTWHIVSDQPVATTARELDRLFAAYVDSFDGKSPVQLTATFYGESHIPADVRDYGFEEGDQELQFQVYCEGYLPDPNDWSRLIRTVTHLNPGGAVPATDLETFFIRPMAFTPDRWQLLIARDSQEERYAVRGFTIYAI